MVTCLRSACARRSRGMRWTAETRAAAVADVLRPYVESSFSGESGVGVNLTTGIELIFGNANQAPRKWRAVAGVLSNPEITALDYVNVTAPNRPSFEGSEHELPPAP